MRSVVASDLDGVLADTYVGLTQFHNDLYGTSIDPHTSPHDRLADTWNCTRAQMLNR